MKYMICLCLLLAVLPASLYAQSLPDEMRLSDDGRMLITGGTTAEGLYDHRQGDKSFKRFGCVEGAKGSHDERS